LQIDEGKAMESDSAATKENIGKSLSTADQTFLKAFADK